VDNYSKSEIEHIKLSKMLKTQGFKMLKNYDIFLYIDGRISITMDINTYLKKLENDDIIFMKHRQKSILEHFNVIIKNNYDDIEMIKTIKKRYDDYNYKYDNGMIEGGVLLFKNNERVDMFLSDWWNEISKYSHRDQLSANFAIFLNKNLKYNIVENPIYGKEKWFKLLKRKKERFKKN